MSHNKFGPDWFSRFDIYWIQTDRQAKFIYRYISVSLIFIYIHFSFIDSYLYTFQFHWFLFIYISYIYIHFSFIDSYLNKSSINFVFTVLIFRINKISIYCRWILKHTLYIVHRCSYRHGVLQYYTWAFYWRRIYVFWQLHWPYQGFGVWIYVGIAGGGASHAHPRYIKAIEYR